MNNLQTLYTNCKSFMQSYNSDGYGWDNSLDLMIDGLINSGHSANIVRKIINLTLIG